MIPCASNLAEENLKANLLSLPEGFKPANNLPAWELVYARDGTLTCKADGQWMSGCSVPTFAAKELLSTMKLDCPTGLFLEPSHPAQVRSALNRLLPRQAIVVLLPDPATLWVFLLCENFSKDLSDGRLFFCTADDLAGLMATKVGLPAPGQFIKTRLLTAERAESLIGAITPIINAENARRNAEMRRLHETIRPDAKGKWVVLAPMGFHAGDYAARHLSKAAGDEILIDADRADQSSPLGVLMNLQNAKGLFTLRLSRKDLPFVPQGIPIATWALRGPTPPAGNAEDILVVPTQEMRKQALEMGWKRVELAAPKVECPDQPGSEVWVFGDANWTPADQRDFLHSSHRLLYEAIGNELVEQPFNLTTDIARFLDERSRKLDIRMSDLDARVFVDELIFPAYTRGILKYLKGQGIWAINPTIENWSQWDETLQKAAVIVNTRPLDAMATLEFSGRPVVNPLGLNAEELLRRIKTRAGAQATIAAEFNFSQL